MSEGTAGDELITSSQEAYDRLSGVSPESPCPYLPGRLFRSEAYLAGKLDAMREGHSTVLDNSCLLFINNLWSGKSHDSTKVPVILAGGLGGTLETGRVLNYMDKGDENRKLCSMYLSIMDRMGVSLDKFGDAHTRLAGL